MYIKIIKQSTELVEVNFPMYRKITDTDYILFISEEKYVLVKNSQYSISISHSNVRYYDGVLVGTECTEEEFKLAYNKVLKQLKSWD